MKRKKKEGWPILSSKHVIFAGKGKKEEGEKGEKKKEDNFSTSNHLYGRKTTEKGSVWKKGGGGGGEGGGGKKRKRGTVAALRLYLLY